MSELLHTPIESDITTITDYSCTRILVKEIPYEERRSIPIGDIKERGIIIIQNYTTISVSWYDNESSVIIDTPYTSYYVYSNDKNHISIRDILYAFEYSIFRYIFNNLANPLLLPEVTHARAIDISLATDFIFRVTIYPS